MGKLCDLHTHSYFSDGTSSPQEVIDTAVDLGLASVALTDHNTVVGLPDFLAAAEGKPIQAIPGSEFSVDYEGTELHMLGLFLPLASFDQVNSLMQKVHQDKENSNRELAQTLTSIGYPLDYDQIAARTPNGMINRLHFAVYMAELGYTKTPQEALNTLLHTDTGYYREPPRIDVWDMLDFIRSIGAAAVLAHPFLNLSVAQLKDFLPLAKARGLIAMECLYTTFDEKATKTAFDLAEAYGLLPSGGSDFHGENKVNTQLAFGRGNLQIPHSWAEQIQRSIK